MKRARALTLSSSAVAIRCDCWIRAGAIRINPVQALADSRLGSEDTFHYTNAAPQVQHYNDIDWGDLEDYLLDKAQTSEQAADGLYRPDLSRR